MVIELREKDKKTTEHYERIIAAMMEVLRQREDELEKGRKGVDDKLKSKIEELSGKEWIIRELSEEVAHLKRTQKEMEERMREMIDNEEELKKKL